MDKRIWLSLAHMSGREQDFINEAFATNWVVPLGPNVNGFEDDLEKYVGEGKRVVALSAGTAALHLGLVMLDIQPGDEVICQSFTFSASANPIVYVGAKPVFIDSEEDTWNMSPELLEKAIIDRKKATGRYPKAIIPVHLYGMPAKMDEIMAIAAKYGIPVLEDAAEALGSEYKGRKCGTFGAYGALSFNGNKMITTSGGGALVCSTDEEKKRIMFYATQARENAPHYQHEKIGYNYRMSNICAGIGRGQMFVLDEHIAHRRMIHRFYTEAFANIDGIDIKQNPADEYNSNFWLSCMTIDPEKIRVSREDIRISLDKANIETRPLWKPMHLQPVFSSAPAYVNGVSERLFDRGLCLPSGPMVSLADAQYVVDNIIQLINR